VTPLALDQLVQAASALVAVLGLLLIAAWGLRMIRQRTGRLTPGRLRVAETLPIDARHRLVRVLDGDREHLLVLGPAGALRLDGPNDGVRP
jgi:flagellar biogenesis protein FliO